MSHAYLATSVRAVRRFSRFYTSRIGLLHEGLLGGTLSLTEGRVVWELAQGDRTAAALAAGLGLDAGYLSRILRGFESAGLIARRPSDQDGRATLLSLTDAGRAAYAAIDARSQHEIAAMLSALKRPEQQRLVDALGTAEALLSGSPPEPAIPTMLRQHGPGDIGWIIHRQAVLYALEYGLDERFEGLVAQVAGAFATAHDPRRERCWIAERDGAVIGSIVLVRASDDVAKLRLLYVEPAARGLGVGQRLVAECLAFARQARYRRVTLWTTSNLVAARRIYQAAGFHLMDEQPHDGFGPALVGQTWELAL